MSTNPNPPPTRLQVEYALAPRLLDLLPDYERYLVAWGRRPRGIQRSLWILGRLFRQIGDDATLAQFTDEAIERYQVEMAAADRTGATIGNMISCARSFARWALRRKLITTDPTA